MSATQEKTGPWRAFQGANGWYVALVLPDGSHHQALGLLSEKSAKALAKKRNGN